MSLRLRAAAALILATGVLAGAACRWYNLERRLGAADADFLAKVGYLISSAERHAFLELPDTEKPKFIEDFWERRNPNPSSKENAFKIEYYKRIAEADRLFPSEGRPGWATDRGRFLILFGPPTQRDAQPMSGAGGRGQEIWYYGDFPVIFVDDTATGTYRLASSDFGSLREISLMYMHDLNFALDDASKPASRPPAAPGPNALEFEASLTISRRAPDRIEARVAAEMPYERIWLKADGKTMATTLEAVLELRDAAGAAVWESRTLHEIRVRDTDLGSLKGTTYRLEIPVVVEGAERVGRLGPGAALVVALTNATGKESSKKTLDFK
jgi:GWxTD domain-containing protein